MSRSSLQPCWSYVLREAAIRKLLVQLTLDTVRQYLTCTKTAISSKGQIVLPVEFCQMDGVKPGETFEVERLDRGDYRLIRRTPPRNSGAIEWLLACPHKDFFESESTDTQ